MDAAGVVANAEDEEEAVDSPRSSVACLRDGGCCCLSDVPRFSVGCGTLGSLDLDPLGPAALSPLPSSPPAVPLTALFVSKYLSFNIGEATSSWKRVPFSC